MGVTTSVSDVISEQFQSDTYQLIEKIGEGGFACVYRAVLLKTGQQVAIKFLTISTEFNQEKKQRYIDRFERETLLVSKLQHPNIVRLLDKGRSNEHLLYAVFEYINGQTLKQVIAEQGALKPVEAADIMTQVLDALAHAHQLGVIHRDIKPANIMLSKTGVKTHVKVLDFGIGTLINEVQQSDYKSITLTQETLGTPSYSAPEQLRGEPPTIKTDIYVWALVFIECLTAKPVMAGSSIASIFHKQLSHNNVPLSAALVGHPIAAILRRALQKKAHERTVTAQELFDEVSQLNFANLVGDLSGQSSEKQRFNDITVSDNTVINNQTMNFTGQTERKQITALAVCIQIRRVNNEYYDAEVLDAIHHDIKNQCIDIAIRYGAYHVGSLGQQMLFYFGYPNVSDNDSRLSARSALDITSLLQKRSSLLKQSQGIEVKAKIGMNTGLVTCYADSSPEGDTANIAQELAILAEPEQILCSGSSQDILNCYLEFQQRQRCFLGVSCEPQLAYILTAERQAEAFGFLRGHRRNHAFFGRKTQLNQLTDCLKYEHDNVSDMNLVSKLIHIYGEAGIGKSRLVFELRDKAAKHPHLVAQCLPEQQNNALFPILNLVQYKYSLSNLTDEAAAFYLYEKAKALAGEVKFFEDGITTLLAWLNLPLPEGLNASGLAIEEQKKAMFSVLIQLLLSTKQVGLKQLLIVEDMHWVDPTSREFLVMLAKSANAKQTLIITTSRYEPDSEFKLTSADIIKLNQLSPQVTRLFINSLFDNEVVSQNVSELLIKRTDGIPLFIEELVGMLKKNQLVHKLNGIIDFVNPDKLDQVPSTLRDSLQQKLDSLIYAKETAQLAATIGREFDYQVLASASVHSEEQIQNDLNELLAADLIIQHRRVEGDSYIFKHALVRDAAYESMGTKELKIKHKKIACALISCSKKLGLNSLILIAEHFYQANEYDAALKYNVETLKHYTSISSNSMAIQIFEKITKLSELTSNNIEIDKMLLEAKLAVLPAFMSQFGYAGQETIKLSEIIEANISNLGMDIEINNATQEILDKLKWSQFLAFHYSSQRKSARKAGEEILAKSEHDLEKKCCTLVHLAQAYVFDGEYEKSKEAYDFVIRNAADFKNIERIVLEYGSEPFSQGLTMSSIVELMIGNLKNAKRNAEEGLKISLLSKHDISITFGYIFVALYHFCLNDKHTVKNIFIEYENSVEDFVWAKEFLYILNEWACGNVEYAIKSRDSMIKSGQSFALGVYETSIADTLLALNKVDEATLLLEESLDRVKRLDEYYAVPLLLRYYARCFIMNNNITRAKEIYQEAIQLSKTQGAYFKELMCLVDYCEYFDDQKAKSRMFDILIQYKNENDNYYFSKANTILGNNIAVL